MEIVAFPFIQLREWLRFRPYGQIAVLLALSAVTQLILAVTLNIVWLVAGFFVTVIGAVVLAFRTEESTSEFRLMPADRKNPFRDQIIELVRHNQKLRHKHGKSAEAERSKVTATIKQLREWPKERSRQEIEAIHSAYVAQTQQDRSLALLEATSRLEEYNEIALARQKALGPADQQVQVVEGNG